MSSRYIERTKELIRTNEQLLQESKERQKSQDALEQSEKKYRELVENANSIILRVNDQGIITFFNEFAENFFWDISSRNYRKKYIWIYYCGKRPVTKRDRRVGPDDFLDLRNILRLTR